MRVCVCSYLIAQEQLHYCVTSVKLVVVAMAEIMVYAFKSVQLQGALLLQQNFIFSRCTKNLYIRYQWQYLYSRNDIKEIVYVRI